MTAATSSVRTARCTWPLEDVFMTTRQAFQLAGFDVPGICADNGWSQASEPREWQIVEDEVDHIVVTCVVDVHVIADWRLG